MHLHNHKHSLYACARTHKQTGFEFGSFRLSRAVSFFSRYSCAKRFPRAKFDVKSTNASLASGCNIMKTDRQNRP